MYNIVSKEEAKKGKHTKYLFSSKLASQEAHTCQVSK